MFWLTNRLWFVCAVLASVSVASRTGAAIVSVTADADVTSFTGSPPPAFSGNVTFSYDAANPNGQVSGNQTNYNFGGAYAASMSLTLGPSTYPYSIPGTASSMSVVIQEAPTFDLFEMVGTKSAINEQLRFDIQGTPALFSSQALPTTFNTGQIQQLNFLITFPTSTFYAGELTNLRIVPEPTGGALLVVSLLLLPWHKRGRS